MTETTCEATVWLNVDTVPSPSPKKLCGKPAKGVRGPGNIPVCGTHLRAKTVYRFKEEYR